MAEILLALLAPTATGWVGWGLATLTLPFPAPRPTRRAANDNAPARVTLPHPTAYTLAPC